MCFSLVKGASLGFPFCFDTAKVRRFHEKWLVFMLENIKSSHFVDVSQEKQVLLPFLTYFGSRGCSEACQGLFEGGNFLLGIGFLLAFHLYDGGRCVLHEALVLQLFLHAGEEALDAL